MDDNYPGDYVSPDPPKVASAVHGPYRLDQLTHESFIQISLFQALLVIETFIGASVPLVKVEELNLGPIFMDTLTSSGTVYQLRELVDERHGLGWMLGDFNEIVAINRDQRQVLSIIMAFD